MESSSSPPGPPLRLLACRILRDSKASPLPGWNPADFIDVFAGELGYVYTRIQRGGLFFLVVGIRHGKVDKKGLVPEACVTLGTNYAKTMTVSVDGLDLDRDWVAWYRYDRDAYTYRTIRATQAAERGGKTGDMFVCWRSGGFDIQFPATLQKESGLQKGDAVTLQVHISKDSQGNYTPAKVPWIRVPRICHNAEFEKLRSISVELQWRDKTTNELKTTIIQWIDLVMTPENESRMLIQGMALFQTLTQTVYSNPPAWQSPLDRTDIRYMRVDHMRQKAVVDSLPMTRTVKTWPRNYSMTQNTQRLHQAIPPQMQGKIFIGEKPTSGLGRPRNDCDMCTSLYSTIKCDHNSTTCTCTPCSTLNRPCTWTITERNVNPNDLLCSGGVLEDFAWPTDIRHAEEVNAGKEKREPDRLVVTIASEPFRVGIELQVEAKSGETIEDGEV